MVAKLNIIAYADDIVLVSNHAFCLSGIEQGNLRIRASLLHSRTQD